MKTKIFSIILMFVFILSGCSKEDNDTPSLVSGGFNGRVTATVDPEGYDLSAIKSVVPWNGPEIDGSTLLCEQMGEPVSYSNNKFTVNLPDPIPSNIEMVGIKEALENYLGISGTLKCSNADVLVADVDFLAHTTGTSAGYFTGYFTNATEDRSTTCFYLYAEGDVTVTGGSNIAISLKQGWNRIYFTEGKNAKYTTKAPEDGLKWFYEDF